MTDPVTRFWRAAKRFIDILMIGIFEDDPKYIKAQEEVEKSTKSLKKFRSNGHSAEYEKRELDTKE